MSRSTTHPYDFPQPPDTDVVMQEVNNNPPIAPVIPFVTSPDSLVSPNIQPNASHQSRSSPIVRQSNQIHHRRSIASSRMIVQRSVDQQLRNAQLRMEEELNSQAIVNQRIQSRPHNTAKAFDSKQAEFLLWTETKGYDPRSASTVTEAKVALFLNENVLNRVSRLNRNKIIGPPTVDQYITALTALWAHQVHIGANSNPTPRGQSVKTILKSMEQTSYQHKRDNHFDRGVHYQHLLTTEMKVQRRLVADYFWTNANLPKESPFLCLRNRSAYLLSEQGLLRGENVRDAQFPDFFTVEIENEGPTKCIALGLLKGRGKTNQFGKPLFSGFYRHSDVRSCAVSSVAMFLFYRFHIAGVADPDFTTSECWYDTYFFGLSTRENNFALTYRTQFKSIVAAHKKLGITTSKITHGGRYYGKQTLDRVGVEKISANIAGGWSVGAGDGCYGNGLDRPSMRAMAGFHPNDHGLYYLPRACLDPPHELSIQIFPWLEEWERRLKVNDRCAPNIALEGFLRMIRYFRTVILQDAAVMIDEHPHPLWNHQIFKSTAFVSYKVSLLHAMRTNINPITSTIQSMMPELCRQLSTRDQELNANLVSMVRTSSNDVCKKIDDAHSSTIEILHRIRDAFTHILRETANQVEAVDQDVGTAPVIDAAINHNTPSSNEVQTLVPLPTPPIFESVVSEAVITVPEVLMEWEDGFNGRPSISSVETTWGNKWRSTTKHQKVFSRRALIMKLIRNISCAKSCTKAEAASLIEQKRCLKKMSLVTLADKWKVIEQLLLSAEASVEI